MALRQLSALYLTAATAYTVAVVLSQHPELANRAGEASEYVRSNGADATAAFDAHLLQPGWRFLVAETAAWTSKLVAVIDSPVVHTPPKRIAETPGAVRRLSANLVRVPHLHVVPRAQFIPAPRVIYPPPPDSETGLRSSEGEAAPQPANASALSQAKSSAVSASDGLASTDAVAPTNPNQTTKQQQVARASTGSNHLQIAPGVQSASLAPNTALGTSASVPSLPPPSTAEIAQVEQRLKDNLTSEMFNNFNLFLYVSKASNGPWSQRMFVFQKEPSGDLALAYNWPVSTGRERIEFNPGGQQLSTDTPKGYYELDPHRFFPHYVSSQWGEKMPYAMFFNWKKDGEPTGLAIHSATGDDVELLGTRASAGCVRLPPDAARMLFNLIRSKYRGLAPRFAVDRRTGTMSKDGIILHDADGHVQLADGYKVLVFIEDYGGENVVAAMY